MGVKLTHNLNSFTDL